MATTRVLISWFLLILASGLMPALADTVPKPLNYELPADEVEGTTSYLINTLPSTAPKEPLCHAVSTTVFIGSHHHGKSNHGRLNEDNHGLSGTCYFDEERNLYSIIGGLENSQFGTTVFAGPGIRVRTAELARVSLEVGLELPLIYYRAPGLNKERFGILPILYLGLSYRLPNNWGYIEVSQRRLGILGVANKKVDLYSIAWTHKFK
ncbi:MAG: hypothetical protein R3B53_02665 [Candidatus Paceibacterota bacterium]